MLSKRITGGNVGARPEAAHGDTLATQFFDAFYFGLGMQGKNHLVHVIADDLQIGATEYCCHHWTAA